MTDKALITDVEQAYIAAQDEYVDRILNPSRNFDFSGLTDEQLFEKYSSADTGAAVVGMTWMYEEQDVIILLAAINIECHARALAQHFTSERIAQLHAEALRISRDICS
jgi:hypothetical protein